MTILLEQLDALQLQIEGTKDLQEMNKLMDKKQQLGRIILDVRSHRPAGSNSKVNVKDRIYEGVTIHLGNAVEEFPKELSGPLSLIENSREGGLRQLSLSSLDLQAAELEKAWLEEDGLKQQEKREQERLQQEAEAELQSELSDDSQENESSNPHEST